MLSICNNLVFTEKNAKSEISVLQKITKTLEAVASSQMKFISFIEYKWNKK